MKHDILPESWCVKGSGKVVIYLNSITEVRHFLGVFKENYYGISKAKIIADTCPFGQLLTEEQFLYCIGEPTEGEEIEVSNVGFVNNIKAKAFLLKIEKDGAWVVAETDDNTAKWWVDYRRKHLVLEVDKWAKEKQAFAEGKTIESRIIFSVNKWEENMNPSWSEEWEYRIKPEPKYAPFTREDWDLFLGKVIVNKDYTGIVHECNSIGILMSKTNVPYEQALNHVTFRDGSPFGKLIEE